MTGQNETVYIKMDRSVLVHDYKVTINDVASVTGTNENINRHIKQIKVYHFENPGNAVVSATEVIRLILVEYPAITVVNVGEMDFLIEYRTKSPGRGVEILKLVLVCVLIFFGAAFTIMAFHNDIDITGVFDKFYKQVVGGKQPRFSPLKISYTIGLAVGITIFFNHIGKHKITHDPTPIQVEMRKYEKDVDTTFIENASRKDRNVDVD